MSKVPLLYGTVPTGFERTAAEEMKEKVKGVEIVSIEMGKVFFAAEHVEELLNLKSVDHVAVVILKKEELQFNSDKEVALATVQEIFVDCDWDIGIAVWRRVMRRADPNMDQLSFRVTCNRTGAGEQKQPFSSMEAASVFGDVVNTQKGWRVDLTNYDVEIILGITPVTATVSIALTTEPLFRRHVAAFGPTTLRPTICYGLVRLLDPRPGEVILDPLCGGGSIPIEGSMSYPSTSWLAADLHEKASSRLAINIQHNDALVHPLRMDVCHRVWRSRIIDKVVTDLPFGKRSGSKTDNRQLYPKLLNELSRVVVSGGLGVFLTCDKRNFLKAIQKETAWKSVRSFTANVGGLRAAVFVLKNG